MNQIATLTHPATAPYLTKYSEEEWLDVFYLAVRNDSDRIESLRKLAGVKLLQPRSDSYDAIRASIWGVTFNLRAEQCFACFTGSRHLYWHHVIQVQHGGSNNARNIVRLCHRCHTDVHPWLEPRARELRTKWEAVPDIMRRVVDRLFKGWEDARKARDANHPF